MDKTKKFNNKTERKYESRTLSVRAVSKTTAGSRRLRLSVLVVVGDRKGSVGIGLGHGPDMKTAIEKGTRDAEKNIIKVDLIAGTVPHEVYKKFRGARILLKPAKPGTGIIAGSSVRAILDILGVEDVYAKQVGSSDLISNAYCIIEALKDLKSERVLKRMKNMQALVDMKIKADLEEKRKRALKRAKNKSKKKVSSKHEQKNISKKEKSKSKRVSKRVDSKSKQKAKISTKK